MKKMIEEMLQLQKQYDEISLERLSITYEQILERNGYFYAILDELGEYTHESKAKWCWFRKNLEFDSEKALEEYVDLFHFVLSFNLALSRDLQAYILPEIQMLDASRADLDMVLLEAVNMDKPLTVLSRISQSLNAVITLGIKDGWMKDIGDFPLVFEAFKSKQMRNYKRMD